MTTRAGWEAFVFPGDGPAVGACNAALESVKAAAAALRGAIAAAGPASSGFVGADARVLTTREGGLARVRSALAALWAAAAAAAPAEGGAAVSDAAAALAGAAACCHDAVARAVVAARAADEAPNPRGEALRGAFLGALEALRGAAAGADVRVPWQLEYLLIVPDPPAGEAVGAAPERADFTGGRVIDNASGLPLNEVPCTLCGVVVQEWAHGERTPRCGAAARACPRGGVD